MEYTSQTTKRYRVTKKDSVSVQIFQTREEPKVRITISSEEKDTTSTILDSGGENLVIEMSKEDYVLAFLEDNEIAKDQKLNGELVNFPIQ
tara:strand:- start:421 stop:693 length:273 start_codon:yes stop_codon:yes gene_type:complete